jgi:hypothetical protein
VDVCCSVLRAELGFRSFTRESKSGRAASSKKESGTSTACFCTPLDFVGSVGANSLSPKQKT